MKIKASTIPLSKDDPVWEPPKVSPALSEASPAGRHLALSGPEPLRLGCTLLSLFCVLPSERSQATFTAAQCFFSAWLGCPQGLRRAPFRFSGWTYPLSASSPNSSFLGMCVLPRSIRAPGREEYVNNTIIFADVPSQV